MTKNLTPALESVEQMRDWPKYLIVEQPNGTCQIVKKDHDGWSERWYEGLTHEEAGQLADVLNTYRHREFGVANNSQ